MLHIDSLEASLPELAKRYAGARPFPHLVLDDVLQPAVLNRAYAELRETDAQEWTSYIHLNERKLANTDPETWGATLQTVADALMSAPFVDFLRRLTGFPTLLADPSMDGGGLHRSSAGGYLNIHADFTAHHTNHNWQRRVNVLLYLNPEWRPEWGGALELWAADMSGCEERIEPVGNRMVVFTTAEDSFHGHPQPMTCPPGVSRQSLALYYFTEEVAVHARSTNYRGRPGDGLRALPIRADGFALRVYDVVKRRFGLSDRLVSRWLGRRRR